MFNKFKFCIISSGGKGGTGKSAIASNTAVKLSEKHKVGFVDADLNGTDVLLFLNMEGKKFVQDTRQRLYPLKYEANNGNLEVFSTAVWFPQGRGTDWAGEQCGRYVKQFIGGVEWSKAKYLIADMPPSSTDAFHSLREIFGKKLYALITTTSTRASLRDCSGYIDICRKKGIKILGVVENFTGELYGAGGGKYLAEEYGITNFGNIEANPVWRIAMDQGKPVLKDHEVIKRIVNKIERL